MGPAVVRCRQSPVSLLARCVPYLKFHFELVGAFPICKGSASAVYPNSSIIRILLGGLSFGQSHEHGSFTAVRVTNNDDFVALVESLLVPYRERISSWNIVYLVFVRHNINITYTNL